MNEICNNACNGNNACDWEDNQVSGVLVNQGACSGGSACKDWTQGGHTVGANSCLKFEACKEWTGSGYTVGRQSCDGQNACSGIAVSNSVLGDFVCRGTGACADVGSLSGKRRVNVASSLRIVGPQTCVGGSVCSLLGTRANGNIFVDTGACVGEEACLEITFDFGKGLLSATDVTFNSGACYGNSSCSDILLDSEVSTLLDLTFDASCVNNVCEQCGGPSVVRARRNETETEGFECRFSAETTTVVFSADTCSFPTAREKCHALGGVAQPEILFIDGAECLRGTDVDVNRGCQALGRTCCRVGSGPVCDWGVGLVNTICDGSCQGIEACVWGDSISEAVVQNSSCLGEFSCLGFAEQATGSVSIGQGACTDTNSCRFLNGEVSGDLSFRNIVVSDFACNTVDSCRNILGGATVDVPGSVDVTVDSSCIDTICKDCANVAEQSFQCSFPNGAAAEINADNCELGVSTDCGRVGGELEGSV